MISFYVSVSDVMLIESCLVRSDWSGYYLTAGIVFFFVAINFSSLVLLTLLPFVRAS